MKAYNGFKNKETHDFCLEVSNNELFYKLYAGEPTVANLEAIATMIFEESADSKIDYKEVCEHMNNE